MIKRSTQRFLKVLFVLLILVTLFSFSGFAFAQTVILNQTPDQLNAYASDPDVPQSMADNFVVSSPARITQIRLWGIYYSGNTAPVADNFTVIFHSDSAGLPDAVVATESNVPVIRQVTGGGVAGSSTEYEYTLTLATPVNLAPGTYWVEITNDSTADNFYWETGPVDPVNGISGLVYAVSVPGSAWTAQAAVDLAVEITSEPAISQPVPTINEWGMIIFMMLAGAGSFYFIRRQRKSENQ